MVPPPPQNLQNLQQKPVQPSPRSVQAPVQQDPVRSTAGDVIKVGTNNLVFNGDYKGPMIFGKLVNSVNSVASSPTKTANKHEASSSKAVTKLPPDPKYSMPRWCKVVSIPIRIVVSYDTMILLRQNDTQVVYFLVVSK